MTYENRNYFYDTYGKILYIIKETSFDKRELNITFTKELEFAMIAETKDEFLLPYIQAYLPVIKREMGDVQKYVAEQKKLLAQLGSF